MKPNYNTHNVLITSDNSEAQFIKSPTVEVEQVRYEELIKKEERLATIERLLKQGKYVSTDDLKIILEIKGTTRE